MGGAGICIFLNKDHSFEFALGIGTSTNTKAKLIGLWALLYIAQVMGLPTLNIFGDSSVIINWVKGTDALSPPELSHWCRDIRKLCTSFYSLSFSHIYREHNQHADYQSKAALIFAPDTCIFSEFLDGLLVTLMLF